MLTLLEHRGPVAVVTLHSPENRNALSRALMAELEECLFALERDPQVRVVVLAGGDEVFSSGADLKMLHGLGQASSEDNKNDSLRLAQLLETMYTYPKPIVAALEGSAIAGGAGLASVCDIVVSSETAKMGYTEVRLGFVAALVGVFLVRLVGQRRAKELLLTGKLISAEQALEWGLINAVVPKGQALEKALEWAQDIAKQSPTALAASKEVLAQIPGMGLGEALRYAAGVNAWIRTTDDLKEGVSAFLEKRPAQWKGLK
ncbi:MAG: enoyl-CoA hydratase/isomerase family protein [Deinococcaceae bacterium]